MERLSYQFLTQISLFENFCVLEMKDDEDLFSGNY